MSKTIALVTLYYPDETVVDNVMKISNQVDQLILCDNSPDSNKTLFEQQSRTIKYVYNGINLGLSRAFNKVLKSDSYLFNDDDYIIFFDQDSVVNDKHVKRLIQEYEKLVSQGYNIGCIGPAYYNIASNKIEMVKKKYQYLSKDTYMNDTVITSSMLTKVAVLKKIGYWSEDVFLDMADWDLCWKLKSFGFICCMTKVAVLCHCIGIGEKKILFFKTRIWSPIRSYYQTRDSITLVMKKYTPIKFRIWLLLMLVMRPIMSICMDNSKKRLTYILKGMRDFFKGCSNAQKIIGGTKKYE